MSICRNARPTSLVSMLILLGMTCAGPVFAGDELPAGAIRRIHVDLKTSKECLASLAVFPDGNRLAFGTTDGRIVIYDAKRQQITRQFGDRKSYVENFAVSPDGKRLAWSRDFESVTVVDLPSGEEHKCPVDAE